MPIMWIDEENPSSISQLIDFDNYILFHFIKSRLSKFENNRHTHDTKETIEDNVYDDNTKKPI